MRYLYTGELSPYSWAEARRRILVNMGRDLRSVDFLPYIYPLGKKFGNLQQKLGAGPGITLYNRALRRAAIEHRPQIIWIDKGHLVQPSTLRWIKNHTGGVVVNFNTDYLANRKHYWRLHLGSLPLYDFYFTSNALDVDYLRNKGVAHPVVLPIGYYAEMFKNLPTLTAEEQKRLGAEVGFIGHWEPATEALVLQLLDRGLKLRVRGQSWHHAQAKARLAETVETTFLPAGDFVKSIIATKINLGINSTINRNQTSGRSCEIPAAGGFLLAQRTAEHEAMYAEGREAEFFDSADDIAKKANYYLANDAKRREVAAAGRRRCLSSGTSYEEMMVKMTSLVEPLAQRGR